MDIEIATRKFCEYSTFIKGYTDATIRRYRHMVSYYRRYAGITDLSEVNNDNVRALFLYGRTERQWTVNTFICFHKTLLVFFRWCIAQGYMQKNPIEDIEVPRLEKKLPPKLTKQDTLKLLEIVYNYP